MPTSPSDSPDLVTPNESGPTAFTPAYPVPDIDRLNPDAAASLQLIIAIGMSFKFVDDYVRPRMMKLGLTMTEFSTLATLFRNGPTPLGELSQRILLTGASTTYTVKKLEQRGLLTRTPMKEDQRIVLGTITDEGRTLLKRIFPIHEQHLVEVMESLSVAEKRTAALLLRKLQKRAALRPE